MAVWIKGYQVDDTGIEFEIRDHEDDHHIGDLFVTRTGLIWCPGRTWRQNGRTIPWAQLHELTEGLNENE